MKEFCQNLSRVNNKFAISDEIWTKIKDFHEPLKMVSNKMQTFQRADLTLSDVFGEWLDLKEMLKVIPQSNFVINLQAGIQDREKSILGNTLMLSSVLLDPRFNIVLSVPQKSIAKSLVRQLYMNLHEEASSSNHSTISVETDVSVELSPSSSSEIEHTNRQYNALENYLSSIEASSRAMNTTNGNESQMIRLEEEIKSFLKLERLPANSSVHEFWEKQTKIFPLLHELSCIIMAVPPSEVSVERNFSKLNFTLNRFRTNLKDTELEKILFLSLNSAIFDSI